MSLRPAVTVAVLHLSKCLHHDHQFQRQEEEEKEEEEEEKEDII